MRGNTLFACLLGATVLATLVPAQAAEIKLFRFFGDCSNEFATETDLSKAYGECGIIQVLTNKFNADNKIGAKVVTQTVDWGTYYDLLSATYSSGNVPDVAVMHRSVLPNFAKRHLVEPVGDALTAAGVDFGDVAPTARDAVTVDGKIMGMPFDIHALLVHINVDLMKQAGLVDAAGAPILPKTPDEIIEQGKKFKAATGKYYLGMESDSASVMSVRIFDSLVWQQGGDVTSADGKTATVNTEAGLNAAKFLSSLYANGLINKAQDYASSEQAFINGETGMLFNGTWGVDNYDTQAKSGKAGLKTYAVTNFPTFYKTPVVWSDSHMWTIPVNAKRSPEQEQAAIAFLKFLYDNDGEWARTGHLAVRQSVLASDAFKALPHRQDYALTATIAKGLPQIQNQRAIQSVMGSELASMWLTGKSPEEAVAGMQAGIDQILRRNH